MNSTPVTPSKHAAVSEIAYSELSTEVGCDDVAADCLDNGEQSSHLFIFDWDDTLLPTTWLQGQGLLEEAAVIADAQSVLLSTLASRAVDSLAEALSRGRVVIITNAEEGWVECSCRQFMPALAPLLSQVQIVSARSTYEQHGIFAPTVWKFRAFELQVRELVECCGNSQMHVISIGDSLYEQEALVSVTTGLQNCYAKTLKFEEQPDVTKLIDEHELVLGCLEEVIAHQGNLDLEVSADN